MGNLRNILPVAIAVGFGVINGLYVFGPEFEAQKQAKIDESALKEGAAKPTDSETQTLIHEAKEKAQREASVAALAGSKTKKEAIQMVESGTVNAKEVWDQAAEKSNKVLGESVREKVERED